MTTRTSSASDIGLPSISRRALALAAPVALLAAAEFPPRRCAAAPETLQPLIRAWLEAKAVDESCDRRRSEVSAIYDASKPEEPEALFWRPGDVELFDEYRGTEDLWPGKGKGRWRYDRRGDLLGLREALRLLREPQPILADRALCARKVARIEEILAAVDEHHERIRAWWCRSGMEAAEQAAEDAAAAVADIRQQIIDTPARSLADILAKARVGADCFGDSIEEIEAQARDQIEGTSGIDISISVLIDLARFAQQAGPRGYDA